ncbi:MAG: hypothetical protein EZS28_003252 [Streblomastix strix]|uniref:Uncharacterized protein n=1 Tax=Streblomastix strix TaxID=222440 RepID=A0A5J4X3K0_9EUKA|nr:MAG: hypothetical protein EZS28_003252 [Streblomastix strix]
MQYEQEIQDATTAITSFADSYTHNKGRKSNDQSESESTAFISNVSYSLQLLRIKIHNNKSSKPLIQIPNLFHTLVALTRFKLGTLMNEQYDRQRFQIRFWSRECLWHIQFHGDEQVQYELVKEGYGSVLSISFSTAGGSGEEDDYEIYQGLRHISDFLENLSEGNDDDFRQPIFPNLPQLARISVEQVEEEGGNEELDVQMTNKGKGQYNNISYEANTAKGMVLNFYIDLSNTRPFWYN